MGVATLCLIHLRTYVIRQTVLNSHKTASITDTHERFYLVDILQSLCYISYLSLLFFFFPQVQVYIIHKNYYPYGLISFYISFFILSFFHSFFFLSTPKCKCSPIDRNKTLFPLLTYYNIYQSDDFIHSFILSFFLNFFLSFPPKLTCVKITDTNCFNLFLLTDLLSIINFFNILFLSFFSFFQAQALQLKIHN